MYATRTGSTCDQTLNNNVAGGSRMYVAGNLCLSNNVELTPVDGDRRRHASTSTNNASVGASTSMSTRVETYVGGNCRYSGGLAGRPVHRQPGRETSSKQARRRLRRRRQPTAPCHRAAAADFASWYENAIPGPVAVVHTSSPARRPAFDTNYPSRDNSVSTPFDLTPALVPTRCRVRDQPAHPSGRALVERRPHEGSDRRRDDLHRRQRTHGHATALRSVQRPGSASTSPARLLDRRREALRRRSPAATATLDELGPEHRDAHGRLRTSIRSAQFRGRTDGVQFDRTTATFQGAICTRTGRRSSHGQQRERRTARWSARQILLSNNVTTSSFRTIIDRTGRACPGTPRSTRSRTRRRCFSG